MKRRILSLILVFALVMSMLPNTMKASVVSANESEDVYLSDMEWSSATGFLSGPVKNATYNNQVPQINGTEFKNALGVHPVNDVNTNGDIVYNIEGMGFKYFETFVGLSDNSRTNHVNFIILVDGVEKICYMATGQQNAKKLVVSVDGAKQLTLRINCADDVYNNDGALWGNPVLKKTSPDKLYLNEVMWKNKTDFHAGPIQNAAWDNGQAQITGVTYEKALGVHPTANTNGDIVYGIEGLGYTTFETLVGISDTTTNNHVNFIVLVDGVEKFSYMAIGQQAAKKIVVPVDGAKEITLRINCADDGHAYDGAIWAEPTLGKKTSGDIYLSDMSWESTTNFYAGPIRDATWDNQTIQINNIPYEKGLGVHPNVTGNGDIIYSVKGMGYNYFEAFVGLSDNTSTNHVNFIVLVDGVEKMHYMATNQENAKKIIVPIKGAEQIILRVDCANDGHGCDGSVWANAVLKQEYNFENELKLNDLGWNNATALNYGIVQVDSDTEGNVAKIAGVKYDNVIGTHTLSDVNKNQDIVYNIENLGFKYFETLVGVGHNKVGVENKIKFTILVDGVEKTSYVATANQEAKKLVVLLDSDVKTLTLRINAFEEWNDDNAIWANPLLQKQIPDELYLSDINWDSATEVSHGTLGKDQTVEGQVPIIAGIAYDKAIGTHALDDMEMNQDIVYNIESLGYKWFECLVGVQDQDDQDFLNNVRFTVLIDGVEITKRLAKAKDGAQAIGVNIEGAKTLTLRVNCSSDGYAYDNAIWALPRLSKTIPIVEPKEMPDVLDLTELDWVYAESGYYSVQKNLNTEGGPLKIKDTTYDKGLGTHAFPTEYPADIIYDIAGMGYQYFSVDVGTDAAGSGTVQFEILGGGEVLAASPILGASDEPYRMNVKVADVKELVLRVYNGDGTYHHDRADWGAPTLYKKASLMPVSLRVDKLYDGKVIYDKEFTISGTSSGLQYLNIYVDNELAESIVADDLNWKTVINIESSGQHIIKVEGVKDGKTEVSQDFVIEKVDFQADETVILSSKSTELKLGRMGSRLVVQSLKSVDDDYEWLSNLSEVELPKKILIDGVETEIAWKYDSMTDEVKDNVRTVVFHFYNSKYKLTLDSIWTSYPKTDAPVRHSLDMWNNGDADITVYSVSSLKLDLKGKQNEQLELMAVFKGNVSPDGIGTYLYDITSGMTKDVYTASEWRDSMAQQGYMPFAGIQGNNHGLYIGLEWPQGHTLVEGGTVTDGEQEFSITNGLNADFYTIIPADMNYLVPTGFIGTYSGSRDDGSNELTKWYYDYMMPDENKEDKYPTLQYSYWWSTARTRLEWVSTDEHFFEAVDQYSQLGFTAGVLDIGWNIADGVFVADPIRWENGLKKHADYSHEKGMEFGVYFRMLNGLSDLEGSMSSVEGVGDPEWFAEDGNSATIDLGNDEAAEALLNGLRQLISDSGLDVLRTDFGGIIGRSERINRHSNDTDVTYWTARAWYGILDELFAEFPGLKWENCDIGGTLKDFKSLQYASRVQATDSFSALTQRQTFYDASYLFPAQQILLWYSELIHANFPTDDYDYLFRSMILGCPAYLGQLVSDMVPEEKESITRTAEIYNEWMQQLIKHGNLYKVLPRANGVDWDGIQYIDPNTGKGAVLVFKGTTNENTKVVKLDGLDEGIMYHIWSEDRTVPYAVVSGEKLMNEGVSFTLEGQYKSEILYIQEVGKDDDNIKAPGEFSMKSETTLFADIAENVTVEWNDAELTDYYTVSLYQGNVLIAEMNTEETNVTFKGLEVGVEYACDVVAKNAFGESTADGNKKIKTQGKEVSEKLINMIIQGDAVCDNCEDSNTLYLDSLIFETDDAVLSTNENKTMTAQLDSSAGYKTLVGTLAISNYISGMQVEVVVSTDKGVYKEVLLNENDIDRNFSIDIEGASLLTITVKNTSKDILQVTERLLTGYADSNNAYKDYYRVLHNQASNNYLFSADVKHDIMGVIDATPRYGIFAGYVDADNYVGVYLDRQYNLFTTVARVNGENSGTIHIPLPEDFNHDAYHTLTAYRNGDVFKLYLDGELMDVRIAAIDDSKPGLSDNDTWATYKNIWLEDGNFRAEEPIGGTWNGLAPVVVLNSSWIYDDEVVVSENEPEELIEDEKIKIDKSAFLDEKDESTETIIIDFSKESDEDLFKYYSSNNAQWKLEDEKLISDDGGEQKAILKNPISIKNGSIQADISLKESGKKMNGGLYIYGSNIRNGQDAIRAMSINLTSEEGSRDLRIEMFKFDQEYLGSVASTTLSNFFKDGKAKAPVTLKVTFEDGKMSVYVNGELQIPLMGITVNGMEEGAVGLRAQLSPLEFDNVEIKVAKLGTPQKPDIPNISDEGSKQEGYTFNSIWDALDFDFYHSSNGGFTIRDGKLTPSGEEGEFKAVLRGDNRAYKSVSVDIYPGADGTINSGLYIGATGVGHAVDKINALGILVQSDFEGWSDAANRIDIIIGEFPEWKELSRTISETGKKNELYSNGVKEPLNLRVDIDGNKVIVTLSLLSDPSMYVQTVYEYTGELDLEHGTVGVRSMFDDCSFDNFKVSYDESTGSNTTANGNVSNNESGKGTTGSANTGDPWTTTLSVLSVTTIVSLGVILFLLGKKKKEQF